VIQKGHTTNSYHQLLLHPMAQLLPFATFLVQQEPYIVRITIHHETGDNQDFQDIIKAFMKIFEAQQRVAVIIDATALKLIPRESMKDIRQFMRENRATFERYLRASSIIIRSVIIKNIINTIFKIQPPIRPNLLVTAADAAEAFVAQYV